MKQRHQTSAAHIHTLSEQQTVPMMRLSLPLYLNIDPVLEAALGLRLHQPVTVLWSRRGFCFSFPPSTNCFLHRSDCFAIVIFSCVVGQQSSLSRKQLIRQYVLLWDFIFLPEVVAV